jgi:hypothetical protein
MMIPQWTGADRRKDEGMHFVKTRIVAELEFLEWTGADHLGHTKVRWLRGDKHPRNVVREI